jgi:TPR repeat protein
MRSALLAVGGALLAVVFSALAAWGFIHWRSSEQSAALAVHAERCYGGAQKDCDRLRAACEKRSGIACRALAVRYLDGKGIEPDPPEGLRLLDEACRNNDGEGCLRSAKLRRADDVDPEKAAEALKKACSLGDERACELARQH